MSNTHKKVSIDKELNVSGRGLLPGECAAQIQDALGLLEGRWKMNIIAQLFACSPMRLSEFRRAIPKASEKMLIQQLRALEEGGVVSRTVYAQVPPKVEYNLTEVGSKLRPVFLALLDWSDYVRQ